MEAIRQRLNEVDDIAEVINIVQNLSIQQQDAKTSKKEGKDARSSKLSKDNRSACNEVRLPGK